MSMLWLHRQAYEKSPSIILRRVSDKSNNGVSLKNKITTETLEDPPASSVVDPEKGLDSW